jgi:hypothetical protein
VGAELHSVLHLFSAFLTVLHLVSWASDGLRFIREFQDFFRIGSQTVLNLFRNSSHDSRKFNPAAMVFAEGGWNRETGIDIFILFYVFFLSMKERLLHLSVQKLKKIISRPPTWLVVGVILTVITTLACKQLIFYDCEEWGGTTVRYGYPFNIFIVSSRHYWISKETTVSKIFQPIQFMLNLLFYSGSSYLVMKSAVFINNRIPLNILEKAGIIIVSPYFFLQALKRIAHQLGLYFRPIPTYGLHL